MTIGLTETKKNDILIVTIEGRLDAVSSPLVERKLVQHLEAGVDKLILNFANVDYVSSAGMRVLLALTKKLHASGGQMVLANVAGPVMEVIQMAGFDRLLQICSCEADALKHFTA